jgi:oligoendopeptidase F
MVSQPTPFVPEHLDATDFDAVEPLLKALLARPVRSVKDLEQWLIDRGELAAACGEAKANLYITMTCDTDDTAASAAFEKFIVDVEPRLKPHAFELDKRFVELAAEFPLDPARYTVIVRDAKAEVELFREENIPLETELAQLGQKFEQLAGSLTVQFDGREQTLPQMARYQEQTDRAVRESAWRATAERRAREVGGFSDIYDQMIALRTKVAKNAGFGNYVAYAYKAKHRFDYTEKHCRDFHEGVEKAIVPLVRALDRDRATKLGVEPLRPWDLSVDVKGRGPLRPFSGGRDLMTKSVAAMRSLDPRLAAMLASMGDGSEARGARGGACLDLDSRKGKAPGGYQYMRDRSRQAFIFMNAAGLQKDVETMVHEAGHAFHSMLCRDEPLLEYRGSPIEFAEVASMSMELLSMRHLAAKGSFYENNPTDFARATREQLKRSVHILPWIATIDAFQHWVYANPGHTRAEREQHWLSLDARFGNAVSWGGIESHRANLWQRQLHLFSHPFYYIEYGIAQLGALQLWLISLEKGEKTAVDHYTRALSLGGSRPLPELFRAAGLEFGFGPGIISRLAERVQRELEKVAE